MSNSVLPFHENMISVTRLHHACHYHLTFTIDVFVVSIVNSLCKGVVQSFLTQLDIIETFEVRRARSEQWKEEKEQLQVSLSTDSWSCRQWILGYGKTEANVVCRQVLNGYRQLGLSLSIVVAQAIDRCPARELCQLNLTTCLL